MLPHRKLIVKGCGHLCLKTANIALTTNRIYQSTAKCALCDPSIRGLCAVCREETSDKSTAS